MYDASQIVLTIVRSIDAIPIQLIGGSRRSLTSAAWS
jgi:hypothetical protein